MAEKTVCLGYNFKSDIQFMKKNLTRKKNPNFKFVKRTQPLSLQKEEEPEIHVLTPSVNAGVEGEQAWPLVALVAVVGSGQMCYKGWKLQVQELEASSGALQPYWRVMAD